MKKIFLLLTTLLISGVFFSCKSIREIPVDKTANQIIQMGQNAATSNSYADAEFCYQTVLERFKGDYSVFVQAKYELGHIYTKQKKYDKAISEFNAILTLNDETPGVVPPEYIKLCNMGLERIAVETAEE